MKTFEEKYTVWLDGGFDKEEAARFESEHELIAHDKTDFLKLKTLLKENSQAKSLENPDFFNSQIMAAIDRETSPPNPAIGRSWFGLPRIAWSGAFALLAGIVLFYTMIPRGDLSNPRSGYVAEVLKTKTVDPKIHATVDSKKDMTIIQIEGLDKVPTDKEINQ
jgi:hypothetical protein